MAVLLAIRALSQSFGGVRALDDVTWNIEQGSISALIGPNGAGKTTLFNCITGFLKPLAGSAVQYGDEDVTGWATHRLARAGLVRTFQHPKSFLGMTVRENVFAAARVAGRPDETEPVLEAAGLLEFADRRASECPYGVIRRLNLAMAMATDPKLIMLDEPAAGLNDTERRVLARNIAALRQRGCTVVLVEHDMNFVMSLADTVTVLDAGRVLMHGSPAEVTANEDVIRIYLGQFADAEH
ncbi:Lipopolysaccharide export system ATP-binding protein LptB [Variovorax sp. SRS16]|uniref:ABC transporter ATP-binding protein n=1 Tax=Variovorax sp. SRS16 TaxID=282217 RepID=UPI0013183E99|nr:ABC transporter ATP-binding protein [Variovorax sp. SRS16]VTU15334.1 Lipopolysaccharide export system ATP-binding protein LptB [Variovorax sp. SRS16]